MFGRDGGIDADRHRADHCRFGDIDWEKMEAVRAQEYNELWDEMESVSNELAMLQRRYDYRTTAG